MSHTLTGVEYLGCPYDIYGYYARGNSVNTSQRLFTLPDSDTSVTIEYDEGDNLEYYYPKEAIGTPVVLGKTYEKVSIHESTEDISTQLSASVKLEGSYGLFSAEAEAKYSEAYTSSSYFYHIDQVDYIHSYKLTLDLDYAVKHLDKDFRYDVYGDENGENAMDATALVEKYGTHFLYEAIFGGRRSYSQSVSKLSYDSSSDAAGEVTARYSTYAASISSSSQTDQLQSNHQSNGEFWCIGGIPETLTDGFAAWEASVPGNFVLVDFTTDSLKRISELVEDETRKEAIDTAIQAVLDGVSEYSPNGLSTSSETQEWSEGIDHTKEELEQDSGAKEGHVVVGFGGRIQDKKFIRIAVCYLNLATAQRDWEVFGDKDKDSFNEKDYETLGEVPKDCVVTGIGLSGGDSKFKNMVLHYQELTPASPANNYLDTGIQSIAFRGKEIRKKPDNSYEVEFNPGSNNRRVITGIGAGCRGSNKKIQDLKLYFSTIEEDS